MKRDNATGTEYATLSGPDVAAVAHHLWADLGRVPLRGDGERIDGPFLHFPAGTTQDAIIVWFEDRFGLPLGELIAHEEGAQEAGQ